MSIAIRNAVIVGALYCFGTCALRFMSDGNHAFFGHAELMLEMSAAVSFGYFLGYMRGRNNPDGILVFALRWVAIYFLGVAALYFLGAALHVMGWSWSLQYLLDSPHSIVAGLDHVLEAGFLLAFSCFLGYRFGVKIPLV